MPPHESLDGLIAKTAADFAFAIRAVAATAKNEEEIRIETEKLLAFIQKEAGIKLEGRHEFTVASGRVDSVYDRVIIEYKNPTNPGTESAPRQTPRVQRRSSSRSRSGSMTCGPSTASRSTRSSVSALTAITSFSSGSATTSGRSRTPSRSVDIPPSGFCGRCSTWAPKGEPFSPEYLAGDFGSEGQAGPGRHPRALRGHRRHRTSQGPDLLQPVENPLRRGLRLRRGQPVGQDQEAGRVLRRERQGLKPAELLFAVHTYYAIFMKLLASEIVAFFHKLPTPLQKMMQAATSNKLKREMEDLEAGSIFRHLNITNFLEGDLFAWYTAVWTEPIEKLVRDMVARLDNYNPGTLSEDPAGSRDLLKKLYQQLFPKSVRHDLGEYYTPDWLADHVLNETWLRRRPRQAAARSGVRLGHVPGHGDQSHPQMVRRESRDVPLRRGRLLPQDSHQRGRLRPQPAGGHGGPDQLSDRHPRPHRARGQGRDSRLLVRFDLDAVRVRGPVWGRKLKKAREFKTAAGTFLVPAEISQSREEISRYAEQLEFCIRNRYPAGEFVQRCRDDQFPSMRNPFMWNSTTSWSDWTRRTRTVFGHGSSRMRSRRCSSARLTTSPAIPRGCGGVICPGSIARPQSASGKSTVCSR